MPESSLATIPFVYMSTEDLLGSDLPSLTGGPLAESCRYAVSQTGKQLRVRLVVESSRLGTGDGHDVQIAARAVELLHIATLAHDDVVDEGKLRRGRASLDSKHGGFAAGHTGAWLFGAAVELGAQCGDEAAALLADTACQLCDGEMLEVQDIYNTTRSEERYLSVISRKTASLFSLSARLGGLAGHAPLTTCSALSRFGDLVGMAFQLADDLLDLLADQTIIGKPACNDLRHGIFTLPVIYAVEVDPRLHEVLANTVDAVDEVDAHSVAGLVEQIRVTGAIERTAAVCTQYGEAARSIARELGASSLESFVDQALDPLVRLDIT
jgi:heptaprenyl diphosphate synthase